MAVADSGGGRAPPFWKEKKRKRAPLTEKVWYTSPPLKSRRLLKNCGTTPPPLNRDGLRRPPKTSAPLNRVGFWRPRKMSATTPPPTEWIAAAFGDHGKFLLLPTHPPPLNRDGFWRPREISATTPPPSLNRVDLGTSHERGPLFRKILDLRLHGIYVCLWLWFAFRMARSGIYSLLMLSIMVVVFVGSGKCVVFIRIWMATSPFVPNLAQ